MESDPQNSSQQVIYVSYDATLLTIARKLDAWRWTNPPADEYAAQRREPVPVEGGPAHPLAERIAAADVVICLIGELTRSDRWTDWELRTARAAEPPRGLVGILLQPWNVRPRAICDCGAIFVPFRRDAVERAVAWASRGTAATGDFELVDED